VSLPVARALRRLAQRFDPDAWADALIQQQAQVRAYADLTQTEAARLALLTERVGAVSTAVRLGDVPLEDELAAVGVCVAEWLEEITA
jgi:hypothetical protein